MNILNTILSYLGGSVVFVGICWYFFRVFGEKWISSIFEKQLQESRHAHDKELQELKQKFETELTRLVKVCPRRSKSVTVGGPKV